MWTISDRDPKGGARTTRAGTATAVQPGLPESGATTGDYGRAAVLAAWGIVVAIE
jgi:hypothetical protein